MPLPAALLAKLAKRGILQQTQKNKEPAPGFVEEVIAENYDDPKKSGTSGGQKVVAGPQPKPATTLSRFHRLGHYGCPNKTNVYHRCVQFCVTKWGRGHSQPDTKYNRRRLKMLKKYPLPPNWSEVYDPGRGRYYYWDTTSDEVCWRSPLHPKAKTGPSAAALRVKMIEEEHQTSIMGPPEPPPAVVKPPSKLIDSSEGKFSSVKLKDSDSRYKPYKKDSDRRRKDKNNDELDPMDPSSYSDVPRGTWSTGLREDSEGRTGVDTTASGPLFQMRPYPSPGAILRANAGKKDK